MRRRRILVLLGCLVVAASGCRVHIVGDSTAFLVQFWAADVGVDITGSPEPSCGYGTVNGNRVSPDNPGGPGYPVCVLDVVGADAPDAVDDVIFAFVSIHDAMCSTVDGCGPFDLAAYTAAHAHLETLGHDIAWVAIPLVGGQPLQERITALNAAVALELGCELVPGTIRQAEMWDGLHYTKNGGLLVGLRLAALAEEGPPVC